jgi:hypothetical protein
MQVLWGLPTWEYSLIVYINSFVSLFNDAFSVVRRKFHFGDEVKTLKGAVWPLFIWQTGL